MRQQQTMSETATETMNKIAKGTMHGNAQKITNENANPMCSMVPWVPGPYRPWSQSPGNYFLRFATYPAGDMQQVLEDQAIISYNVSFISYVIAIIKCLLSA